MAHDYRPAPLGVSQSDYIQQQGRFVLVERLANTAMVQSFRAWDQHAQADRMLRVLKPELCRNPVVRERFVHDAAALRNVEHKHLLRIHDVDGRGPAPHVVMDYPPGGSIHARIARKGALPPRRALQVAQYLAEAVAVVHGLGMVHRDVTPKNVLLTERGVPQLGAPGLWLDDQEEAVTVPHAAIATLGQLRAGLAAAGSDDIGYIAPEQIEDPALADARADVYALGATLWTLATGQHARVLFGSAEPSTLTRLPDALRVVILGCSGYQPEDRYRSMREVLDALALAISPAPGVPVRPAPPTVDDPEPDDFDDERATDVKRSPASVPPPAPSAAAPSAAAPRGSGPPDLPPRTIHRVRRPPRRIAQPEHPTPTLEDRNWIERPKVAVPSEPGDRVPRSVLPGLLVAIVLVLGAAVAVTGGSTLLMRMSEQEVEAARQGLYDTLAADQVRHWLVDEIQEQDVVLAYEGWRRTAQEPQRVERALAFVQALEAQEPLLAERVSGTRLSHAQRTIDGFQEARDAYQNSVVTWHARARGIGRIAIRVGAVAPPSQ